VQRVGIRLDPLDKPPHDFPMVRSAISSPRPQNCREGSGLLPAFLPAPRVSHCSTSVLAALGMRHDSSLTRPRTYCGAHGIMLS
jgi:hypothetical protein